jgi:Mce-associated membrane protein
LTSSADPRRSPVTAGAAGAARRRVAGARRRGRPTGSSTLVLDRADLVQPDTGTELADEPADEAPAVAERAAEPAPEPEPEPAAEPTTSEAQAETAGAGRRASRGLWAPAIGAAIALALLATTLVHGLRPTVSDGDRTAAVGSARTTLESLLSYSGSSFDKHVGEVAPQLTSPFKEQFAKVAATDIKPMAVKNEATVQAKVYETGVMDASGDGGEGTTVRVLAFVNQATTTKSQQAPAIDQNRVIATMRKVGDRWLVSELSAF